jgi:hypothetical protein
MSRVGRYLWVGPWTVIGAVGGLVAVATGASIKRCDGVLEISGGILARLLPALGPRPGIAAITIGHAVWATGAGELDRTRAHERVHVAQYERWGPFFPAVYLAASAAAWLRGGDSYLDNRFESEARRLSSGVVGAGGSRPGEP